MLRKALLGVVLSLGLPFASAALAAPDSNADADGGFHKTVAHSSAVMIKVPIDQHGDENTNAAEMRLITNGSKAQPADFASAWAAGTDVSKQPVVTKPGAAGDTSTATDSSTWGSWGWGNWYGWGWSYDFYYTYQPFYYYYPAYYYYSTPFYYSYYGGYGSPYWGYRYYYYPACW